MRLAGGRVASGRLQSRGEVMDRAYLDRFPKADIDPRFLADLKREMAEAVPEIVESIRRREQLAEEIRRSPVRLFSP